MPANQIYSTRIHSRRQLGRVREHLAEVKKVITEVGSRYVDALPLVSGACIQIIDLVDMLDVLIEDMRRNI